MEVSGGLDLTPVWLTVKLAGLTVGLLLILGMPLAWWLARTRSPLKIPVEAVTALPLVLPPTVLGFYLLIFLGASGPAGQLWSRIAGPDRTHPGRSTGRSPGRSAATPEARR